ncbi:MAG: tRNA dihydrouridine synthase DusB [Bacillota bacterium]|nr:tRNA dihydrouridine synthase DusB [Bacillota bacterium]
MAPMAGVTDSVYRYFVHREGAGLSYTELISAKGLYYKSPGSVELLYIDEREGDVGIQLFGNDPDIIANVVRDLEGRPNVLIDINMGCPVPKVFKNGEGSALLQNPDLAARLVEAAKKNTKKPVTCKMRIGIDDSPYDYVGFAKRLEEAGADAVAVHGRTRQQYYSGSANWEAIKEIKEELKIPVIGNGDVFSLEDADRMKNETGCDFVMIGRGALGNPWIFSGKKPSTEEIKEQILEHVRLVVEYKGERRGIKEMRKHTSWYLKGVKGAAEFRRKVNYAETSAEIESLLKEI